MLNKIKMFFARICWKIGEKVGVLISILLIVIFGVSGVILCLKSFNVIHFFLGLILITMYFIIIIASIHWKKELPEYKAKEKRKNAICIIREANEVMKRIKDNILRKKLSELIVLCGSEENIYYDAVEKTQEWVANYVKLTKNRSIYFETIKVTEEMPRRIKLARKKTEEFYKKL